MERCGTPMVSLGKSSTNGGFSTMSLEGHISIAFLALKGDVWFEQKPVLEEHVQKKHAQPNTQDQNSMVFEVR
jgi:hypothetical protein